DVLGHARRGDLDGFFNGGRGLILGGKPDRSGEGENGRQSERQGDPAAMVLGAHWIPPFRSYAGCNARSTPKSKGGSWAVRPVNEGCGAEGLRAVSLVRTQRLKERGKGEESCAKRLGRERSRG